MILVVRKVPPMIFEASRRRAKFEGFGVRMARVRASEKGGGWYSRCRALKLRVLFRISSLGPEISIPAFMEQHSES